MGAYNKMKFIKIFFIIIFVPLLSSCSYVKLDKNHMNINSRIIDDIDSQKIYHKGYTIYFEENSYSVPKKFIKIITNHANFLISNPNIRIRIEGYTNNMGSSEYNIALSQCRAETVSNMMQLLGVAKNQIYTVSFGNEKSNSNIKSYLFDKVEIIYLN